MSDRVLREALVGLLTHDSAHPAASAALDGVNDPFAPAAGLPHSVWELAEHMRRAQEDILRYTLDPSWVSPEFPGGYWPEPKGDRAAWDRCVAGFRSDLAEVVALARDPARDLTAVIPHGEGRTYLRQVLLVADHNAYHAGQIVLVRKALGDWPASRPPAP